jgi:dipeptidyl aminopeptidase/acylaminoacyl peptidase
MRQIAYLTEDGQVRSLDLDSGQTIELSNGADRGVICNWPCWAPDGERLAYFAYEVRRGEVRRASVVIVDADGGNRRVAFAPSAGGLIYMAWSPDSRWLTVLDQEGDTLSLKAIDWNAGRDPITMLQGAPLYFCWAPDSSTVVAHVGTERIGGPATRLSWINLAEGQSQSLALTARPAPGFRAPVWSTGQTAATVAIEASDGSDLALIRGPDQSPEGIAHVGAAPAFAWSPDGNSLAVVDREASDPGAYRRLGVLRDGEVVVLAEEPMLAFFWAADSRRLLYLTGEQVNRSVRVRSVALEGGGVEDAGWVRPTRDFVQLTAHFDQYVQSCTVVSPQGELALAASRAKELENGPVPTVRQVLVRKLDGGEDVIVARGRLAVWRPAR